MESIGEAFFNIEVIRQSMPLLLHGLGMTIKLSLIVLGFGLVGGMALALVALSPRPALRWPARVVIDFFRALPPLVLLVFLYSGLPFAGVRLSPLEAVVIAFLLNNSSYFAEIYRAGFLAVPRGQYEAARSGGLSHLQAVRHVIIPQGIRHIMPDILSNIIEIVKMTSLASVVSLSELLYAANMARAATYNASPLMVAAGLYLVMLLPAVRLVSIKHQQLVNRR